MNLSLRCTPGTLLITKDSMLQHRGFSIHLYSLILGSPLHHGNDRLLGRSDGGLLGVDPLVHAVAGLEALLAALRAHHRHLQVHGLNVLLHVGLLLTAVEALGARPHVVNLHEHAVHVCLASGNS